MEVEAKYALSGAAQGAAILCSPLVSGLCTGAGEMLRMESTYYRDKTGCLDEHGFALRLRKENDRSVCCLKWAQDSSGAVAIRQELECETDTIATGVRGLIAAGAPMEFAAAMQHAELEIAAQVRFTRRTRWLTIGKTQAELAFDEGTFGAEGQVPFFELELEWKAGPEEPFYELLSRMEKAFGLQPEHRSKYERAMEFQLKIEN